MQGTQEIRDCGIQPACESAQVQSVGRSNWCLQRSLAVISDRIESALCSRGWSNGNAYLRKRPWVMAVEGTMLLESDGSSFGRKGKKCKEDSTFGALVL